MRTFYFVPTSVLWLALLLCCALQACGGEGSTGPKAVLSPANPPESPDVILSGFFIDSAVQGLDYVTESQSGRTSQNGEFNFVAGESITFSIGDIDFPRVAALDMMSPLTLFNTLDLNDTRVINLARLLQSLDQDSNAGNGITITESAHNQASGVIVDFAADNFASQVAALIANSGAVYPYLIDEQQALEHLSIALGNIPSPQFCSNDHRMVGYVGEFTRLAHNVSGRVRIVDNCRIEFSQFNYDGGGPQVYFYAALGHNYADTSAFAIGAKLNGRNYQNETLVFTLPLGKTLDDFDSISVWCSDFNANFGQLTLHAP